MVYLPQQLSRAVVLADYLDLLAGSAAWTRARLIEYELSGTYSLEAEDLELPPDELKEKSERRSETKIMGVMRSST